MKANISELLYLRGFLVVLVLAVLVDIWMRTEYVHHPWTPKLACKVERRFKSLWNTRQSIQEGLLQTLVSRLPRQYSRYNMKVFSKQCYQNNAGLYDIVFVEFWCSNECIIQQCIIKFLIQGNWSLSEMIKICINISQKTIFMCLSEYIQYLNS